MFQYRVFGGGDLLDDLPALNLSEFDEVLVGNVPESHLRENQFELVTMGARSGVVVRPHRIVLECAIVLGSNDRFLLDQTDSIARNVTVLVENNRLFVDGSEHPVNVVDTVLNLSDRTNTKGVVFGGYPKSVCSTQRFPDSELLGLGVFTAGSVLDEERGGFVVLNIARRDNIGSCTTIQPLNRLTDELRDVNRRVLELDVTNRCVKTHLTVDNLRPLGEEVITETFELITNNRLFRIQFSCLNGITWTV